MKIKAFQWIKSLTTRWMIAQFLKIMIKLMNFNNSLSKIVRDQINN